MESCKMLKALRQTIESIVSNTATAKVGKK